MVGALEFEVQEGGAGMWSPTCPYSRQTGDWDVLTLGHDQKRTARKSRSGELCFTVFTKLCRFWCAHRLPNATARYR